MAKWLAGVVIASSVWLQSDVHIALREGARQEKGGDTTGALESYTWALQESRPGSRDRGDVLVALAGLEAQLGKYPGSRAHAAEAAGIFSALGDSAAAATALNRAGLASLYEGNYGEAERVIRSAIDLSTRLGDQERRAEQLGNLGNVQFFMGRYADAARLYDEGLAITTAAAAQEWAARRHRIILANQASLYQRLGRDRDALAVYQEIGQSNTDLRPGEQAQLLVNLGVLYRRLGDPIKALKTYDAARALFARDRNADGDLGALKNRGIVLALDLGRFDDAERNFTEALSTATSIGNRREMLHARLYRAEAILRAGDPDRAREDYAAGLTLARELKTPEEEWKALYGLGRTTPNQAIAIEYFTQAVATIEQVRENIRVPALRSDFLNDKREVYDALIAARFALAPAAELFDLLERSHSRGWRERLGLSASVDLGSVQRALPERVLLLDYWHSTLGSAVLAVTRSRAAAIRVAVDQQEIKRLIDGLAAGPSPGRRGFGQAVSHLLPPPDWFADVDRVIIVPDGAVALVPFDLLQVQGRLLIERLAVSYTPTAATLLRPAPVDSGRRPPWRLQLRAFADPVFGSAGLDDAPRLHGRLSGAQDEVRHIASELAGRTALHIASDNRKAYLLEPKERAPLLHLATHAIADATAMEQSRLLFSSAAGPHSSADYLFLKEAYELPLAGVELAVLSACDTERGEIVRGEGVQSFSRAFLAAGARSTVTTLWRVADRPTDDFMTSFYHHLQQGLPRDDALRRAKLRMLNSGTRLADAHYWAAFVLTGDGLRPVPRAVSWTMLAFATLAAALIPPAIWFAVRWARRTR